MVERLILPKTHVQGHLRDYQGPSISLLQGPQQTLNQDTIDLKHGRRNDCRWRGYFSPVSSPFPRQVEAFLKRNPKPNLEKQSEITALQTSGDVSLELALRRSPGSLNKWTVFQPGHHTDMKESGDTASTNMEEHSRYIF